MIHLHFEGSFINIADWIQALASCLLVGISYKALKDWKDKKEYDIYIEAISNLSFFLTTSSNYFFRISNELTARIGEDNSEDIISNMLDLKKDLFENKVYVYFLKVHPTVMELKDKEKYKALKAKTSIIKGGFEEINSLIDDLEYLVFSPEDERIRSLKKLLEASDKYLNDLKSQI